MGNLENLAAYVYRRSTAAAVAGQAALHGMNSAPNFCAGNNFWKLAAGITGAPTHPPEHFEPQNYRTKLSVEDQT